MATVIQITETGEEFAVFESRNPDKADDWIEANAENYPESRFKIINRYETPPYSAYYPE